MMRKDKIWIVIAAYNEEKRIGQVIDELQSGGYKNIVVTDDGSSDMTYRIISQLPVYSLRHAVNRGQGAALKTGIDYALMMGAEFIITFDADGQHCVGDIPSLVGALKDKYQVALGSRFLKRGSSIPLMRKILLKGSVWIIYIFYGAKMTDAHNGIRAFTREAANRIEIKSDGMAHASEIIEEIVRKRIPYREVPVTIKYNRETMQKGAGSVIQAVKVLFRMIWRKLI